MIDFKNALFSLLNRRGEYKVGLFGIGMTTLSLLSVLSDMPEVTLTVRDESPSAKLPAGASARLMTGASAFDCIDEDLLILSPSVRREREELRRAVERGTVLTSECEMFFGALPDAIGITGSDGKSTTATLTHSLLKNEAYSAELVGNIGIPYSSLPRADLYVAELSSFNLSYLSPKLRSAVITNIEPNHLNWHASFGEYVSAKKNILKNAKKRVLSADSHVTLEIIKETGADAVFSTRTPYSLLKKLPVTDVFTCEGGAIYKNGELISDTANYIRREEHNIRNMLAAAALTDGLVTRETLCRTFRSFDGLADRCELVLNRGNVRFYNSSIDTSPARCAVTLCALGLRVRLLLGGRGKGLPLEPLIEPIKKYVSCAAVYGELTDEVRELFSDARFRGIPLYCEKDFDGAFFALTEGLSSGDCVLLSPAATAYGEFRSYRERAERFKALCYGLKF